MPRQTQVHIYCDALKELAEHPRYFSDFVRHGVFPFRRLCVQCFSSSFPSARYKKLEDKLNEFAKKPPQDVAVGREAWQKLASGHGNPVPWRHMGASQTGGTSSGALQQR